MSGGVGKREGAKTPRRDNERERIGIEAFEKFRGTGF
jgi:hypothetical protein